MSDSSDEEPPDLAGDDVPVAALSDSDDDGAAVNADDEPEVVTLDQLINQLRSQNLLARSGGRGVALARAETEHRMAKECIDEYPEAAVEGYDRAMEQLLPFSSDNEVAWQLLLIINKPHVVL